MPAHHHSVFLKAACPSCCPTNSVKALKAYTTSLNPIPSHLLFRLAKQIYTARHELNKLSID